MRAFLWAGALALAITALAAAAAACGNDDDDAATGEGSTATSEPDEPILAGIRALSVPADLVDGMAVGSADAEVHIAVFEDFQCPFCLSFTATQEQFLVEEFVEPGLLRLEFRNFPILGVESVAAAIGAHCAGEQNGFWEFHDELFLVQAEAGQHEDERLNVGRFSDANLADIASRVGLDRSEWEACYTSEAALQAVQNDVRAARDAGLQGTPGFIVNGQALPGAPRTTDVWRELIESLLED